jgi:hypothetical protein
MVPQKLRSADESELYRRFVDPDALSPRRHDEVGFDPIAEDDELV